MACNSSRGGFGDGSLLAGMRGLAVICMLVLLKVSVSRWSSPWTLPETPSGGEALTIGEVRAQKLKAKEVQIKTLGPLGPIWGCHHTEASTEENTVWECETWTLVLPLQKSKGHQAPLLCSDSEPAPQTCRGFPPCPRDRCYQPLAGRGGATCPQSTYCGPMVCAGVPSQIILSLKFFPSHSCPGLLHNFSCPLLSGETK